MLFRLVNAGTGAVLPIRDVTPVGNALTWQWAPPRPPPPGRAGGELWEPVDMGDGTQQLRDLAGGGRLLGEAGPRARAWWFVPDGPHTIEHARTGLRLGGEGCRWEADYRVNGCFQLRDAETGRALGRLWRLRYGGAGTFRIQNAATGRVLSVTPGGRVAEVGDGRTPDRLWRFL
ncbi:hypothetical protein Asp14428_03600 [Actinoplanes sp. NBRC 14428]|uniref:Ricin-type beta-trefoil lectin protein n=1 Tax=Pseudosporangium ferrugineum TaxID=439699 RepID=A0A2T0SIA5_9ACTN|nr:RICIN domain-containing protein [Pseudosporangium ferrugineum]PRY33132.1 hypothetical protein CLV70_101293 [Pseudosporangium ferrugineum]BCJ48885.1 hypothetical protein Asp14428_03600 [Actinoplanes sp. NBRC 14428]